MKFLKWLYFRFACWSGWHGEFKPTGEELDGGKVKRYRCARCGKRMWR